MKTKQKFLGLSVALLSGLVISSANYAADDEVEADKKEFMEMKREHRKEMREMRHAHRSEEMLKRVDTNKDGKIDLNEYLAHGEERFNKMDLDSDGYVTPEEAKQSMLLMRKEHKERRKLMKQKMMQDDS